MFKRLIFYSQQAFYNIKKSVYLILGLSLAISAVAGLVVYFDSYENAALKRSFSGVEDFKIVFQNNSADYSHRFIQTTPQIEEAINIAGFEVESYGRYVSYYCDWGVKLSKNVSDPSFPDGIRKESADLNVVLIDEDYYNSTRFSNYFVVIEGNLPNSTNEVLVYYEVAKAFNFSLGENNILSIEYQGSEGKEIYNVTDVVIAGFYLPRNHYTRIFSIYFEFFLTCRYV